MKYSSILTAIWALLVSSAIANPAHAPVTCQADNCNRAIISKATRIADCNSFFASTTTPSAVYTTSTVYVSSTTVSVSVSVVTNTVYTILGNDFYEAPTVKARDVAALLVARSPTIPAYAVSACTSKGANMLARYSSACSCAGATGSTITASTATIVTTITDSVISTSLSASVTTKTVTSTVSTFGIAATATILGPSVQYLLADESTTSPNYLGIKAGTSLPVEGTPNSWRLSTGWLEDYAGQFAQQDAGVISEWIWVDTPANIAANGWKYIDFIVDPFTLAITARGSDTGNSVLQICELNGEPYLDLAKVAGTNEQTTNSPCYPVILNAVPL